MAARVEKVWDTAFEDGEMDVGARFELAASEVQYISRRQRVHYDG